MRSVADFRDWSDRQWRRHWPRWLVGATHPDQPPVDQPRAFALHPPTQAHLAADPGLVLTWVREWQEAERRLGVGVEWTERNWAAFGRQALPHRVSATPATIAEMTGHQECWHRAVAGVEQLQRGWPTADWTGAVPAMARKLGQLDPDDLVRLVAVAAWLEVHPNSGLWERELPIAEVDTKWVEGHRGLVQNVVEAISGSAELGLRQFQTRFVVRRLDPGVGEGPATVGVDLSEMADFDLRPTRVIICENLTCVSTLPALAGTVAVHGMGFAATALAEVAWIAGAEVFYWGDLDTWGLHILGRVRASLPSVRSMLMDTDTFVAHEHLAVPEPRPFTGAPAHLTAGERQVLGLILRQGSRLEQERLPRAYVAGRLADLTAGPPNGRGQRQTGPQHGAGPNGPGCLGPLVQ